LGLACVSSCGGTDHPPPPDLVVVSVDTLRADHLGAYGHAAARTPNIDGLAAAGRRYTQATTPMPRTTPAIATLLTGLWPLNHGSREVQAPMRELPTLASVLAGEGYATVGVSATRVLSEEQRIEQGFRSFLAERLNAGALTDEALARAREQGPQAPLLLWVHYFDPHFPYAPWPEFEIQPAAPVCRQLMVDLLKDGKLTYAQILSDRDGVSSRALEDCRELYDAEIAFTDLHVGRLLAELAAVRGGKPPVVVFTADHGENFGEGGLYYDHGPNLHDAALIVPLILAGPGVPAGVDEGVAGLEDLMPTLLGLAGIPRERWPEMDGRDLLSGSDDGSGTDDVAFAESGTALYPRYTRSVFSGRRDGTHCLHDSRFSTCREVGESPRLYDHLADPDFTVDLGKERPETLAAFESAWRSWVPEEVRQRSARASRFKLVEYPRLEGGYRSVLYDLRRDPAERRDVAAGHPDELDRLQKLLDAWTADIVAWTARPDRTAEELETLRSLGYVE
jgi:arylsulfatase A-like enzyme